MNKKIIIISTIGIIILVGLFYWFEIRPSEIRKICNNESIEKSKTTPNNWSYDLFDLYYKTCLRKNGLKE